jgi:lysophospholipase L1-like esterase
MNKLITIITILSLVFTKGDTNMADYNIQMGQRNASNTEWDNHFPVTKAENIITANGNIVIDLGKKADKTYVDAVTQSIASGSPKGAFTTLALLQADATANTLDGKKYIYVVTADGKWYYWNGSAWTAGGVYQSTGLTDKSVLTTKLEDSARFDAYPFQPLASFNNNKTAELQIKKAVKKIEIYGADATKKYNLGILQRNFSTYGTGAYIYECNSDGTQNKIVALTSLTSYAIPIGTTEFILNEYQNSRITAKLLIDWNEISDGAQYVNNHFDKSGLDYKTYFDFADSKIKIKLPPKIQGVVGNELNIYFDNIILCDSLDNYDIEVNDFSSGGIQQNERYTIVPTSEKVFNLQISVYQYGKLITSAQSTITIKANTVGSGVNKKCIFIGDSITDGGVYTGELLKLFGAGDVMDITLLGTRGAAPNLHEGRAGWKASDYVGISGRDGITNAFWNPTTSAFDFAYYMAQQGYAGVDVVGINLGVNDIFNYTDDTLLNSEITNILNRYDAMLNSIHTYNINTKVAFLITIPPSKNQDAFGKNYQSGQTQWRYKRNNFLFMSALIEKYKNREADGIYLIPINANLDTEHNMLTETVAVNSRNTDTIVRQSNGVHPATSGFYQIADTIYYWLKVQEN